MPNRQLEEIFPPPGRRSGAGSASILPFLVQSLASKPELRAHGAAARLESPKVGRDAPIAGAAQNRAR